MPNKNSVPRVNPKDLQIHFVDMDQTTYMADAWSILQDVLKNYISGIHFRFNDDELVETFTQKVRHAALFQNKTDFTIEELLDVDCIVDDLINDAAYICMRRVSDGEWSLSRAILVSHALSSVFVDIAVPLPHSCNDNPNPTMFPSLKIPREEEIIS